MHPLVREKSSYLIDRRDQSPAFRYWAYALSAATETA